MEKKYATGVDIGAQTAKIGVVDKFGKVIAQTVIHSNDTEDFDVFLEHLVMAITALLKNGNIDIEEVKGVGVGAPNGNFNTGKIEFAPNLTWGKSKSIDFNTQLREKTGLPCVLTNDANAAAMGEMLYGAAKGMKHFIEITLGTGVGSGIVVNGEVLYGYDGYAGELGHTAIVHDNGRLCGCGKYGCLEAYTSAMGIARTAREFIETNLDVSLYEKASSLRKLIKINSKDVCDEAVADDRLAIEVFNFTGRLLGKAFADFVAFSAPEAIILFGGVTKAGDLIMNPIKNSMEEHLLPIWKGKVKLLFSALNESDAAILGASALGWEAKE